MQRNGGQRREVARECDRVQAGAHSDKRRERVVKSLTGREGVSVLRALLARMVAGSESSCDHAQTVQEVEVGIRERGGW